MSETMTEEEIEAISKRAEDDGPGYHGDRPVPAAWYADEDTDREAMALEDRGRLLSYVEALLTAPLPEALAAIEARAAAATPGPWTGSGNFVCYGVHANAPDLPGCFHENGHDREIVVYGANVESYPVAEFIAHARADVPALLAGLRTQAATIRELTAERDAAQSEFGHAVRLGAEMQAARDAAVTLAKAERAYRVAIEAYLTGEVDKRPGEDAIAAALAALHAAGGEP